MSHFNHNKFVEEIEGIILLVRSPAEFSATIPFPELMTCEWGEILKTHLSCNVGILM